MMRTKLLSCCLVILSGCSQNTSPKVENPARLTTNQDQTAGAGYRFEFPISLSDTRSTPRGLTASSQPTTATESSSADSAATAKTHSDGNVVNAYVSITIGSSATGAQTASGGPQTNTPSGTQTVRADQKPEASLAVPISVALPGGIASGTAAAGTGQSTQTQTVEEQLQALAAQLGGGDPTKSASILSTLRNLFTAPKAPASQPVNP